MHFHKPILVAMEMHMLLLWKCSFYKMWTWQLEGIFNTEVKVTRQVSWLRIDIVTLCSIFGSTGRHNFERGLCSTDLALATYTNSLRTPLQNYCPSSSYTYYTTKPFGVLGQSTNVNVIPNTHSDCILLP